MSEFLEVPTRKGDRARIYAYDGGAPYQIHGAVWLKGALEGWLSYEWTADGYRNADHTPHEFDISDALAKIAVAEHQKKSPGPDGAEAVRSLRCLLCSSTGRTVSGDYCGCNMGVDLKAVETRYKRVEVMN